jgi:hypothetical protein
MITEEQVDSALQYLRETAKPAAVARSQARTMKKYMEVVEAQQKALHPGLTNIAARDAALASPEYKEALDAWQEAVKRDCEFTMLREAASSRVEAWRTQCSNRRAEGRAYS